MIFYVFCDNVNLFLIFISVIPVELLLKTVGQVNHIFCQNSSGYHVFSISNVDALHLVQFKSFMYTLTHPDLQWDIIICINIKLQCIFDQSRGVISLM